jgi:hypothetical protein
MYEEVIAGEAQAGESAEVRQELENLIHTINTSTFDVAELLHKVKSKHYYQTYGFNTFLEYVAELEIKTRKAQYLVRIVDIMEQVRIDREDYQPIGIAKLREITSLDVTDSDGDPAVYDDPEKGETHLMSDIIKGLISKAPEMSLGEIKKYVKILKGFVGDNDIVWLNICVNSQALSETINPALALAKQNLGTASLNDEGVAQDYSDGKALEIIAVEYLNDPAHQFLGGQSG